MKLDSGYQFISQKQAISTIWRVARTRNISSDKLKHLESYILGIPTDADGHIRLDQLQGVMRNLEASLKHNDPEYLARNRGFKTQHVPDVQEAVESKEFANKKSIIWDSVIENLWWIHHGTPEQLPQGCYRKTPEKAEPPCIICLSGAQGSGKSQTAYLSAYYTLLLFMMMHDPHVEFNHDSTNWIIFACQGLKETTTKDSLFDKLKNTIDQSPWFQANAPRQKNFNEELRWPDKMIKVVNLTGEWDAGLGKDIFWAGVTEINEMRIIEHSKRTVDTAKIKFDVGQSMWDNLANRIETRFSQIEGGFPGKLIADSARSHTNDFTSRLKKQALTDSRILIIERTLWDAKSHEYPKNEKKFLVELGDDFRPPRIIESMERAIDRDRVVKVPERHRARFESDCESAAKYFLGEPTRSVGRFIGYPEKITASQTAYVEMFGDLRPFKYPEISIRDMFGELHPDKPIDWQLLINYAYFDAILDKTAVWSMHCDMSRTGDATGFAFGRVIGAKPVGLAHIYNLDDHVVTEMSDIEAPVYVIDGILRIVARPAEIIDPAFIEALGLELKRLVNVKLGSADWIESTQMLLAWRKKGIVADKYSVDSKPDGYFALKHAMREDRLIMMPHEVNDTECRQLKQSALRSRINIDHPEGGSKDCCDSCAGVVGVLDVTEGRKYYRQIDKPGGADHEFGEGEIGDEDDDDDDEFGFSRPRFDGDRRV